MMINTCLLQILKANGVLHSFFFMIVIFLCLYIIKTYIPSVLALVRHLSLFVLPGQSHPSDRRHVLRRLSEMREGRD